MFVYDHGRTDGLTDSPKTECVRHRSNDDGGLILIDEGNVSQRDYLTICRLAVTLTFDIFASKFNQLIESVSLCVQPH